jgi:hypothetical protein
MATYTTQILDNAATTQVATPAFQQYVGNQFSAHTINQLLMTITGPGGSLIIQGLDATEANPTTFSVSPGIAIVQFNLFVIQEQISMPIPTLDGVYYIVLQVQQNNNIITPNILCLTPSLYAIQSPISLYLATLTVLNSTIESITQDYTLITPSTLPTYISNALNLQEILGQALNSVNTELAQISNLVNNNLPVQWNYIQNKPLVFPPDPYSSNLDYRYYTKSQLSKQNSAQIDWSNLINVPSNILSAYSLSITAAPSAIPVTTSSGQLDSSFIPQSITASNAYALNNFASSFTAKASAIPVTTSSGQLDPSFIPTQFISNASTLNNYEASLTAAPTAIPVSTNLGLLDPSWIPTNISVANAQKLNNLFPASSATPNAVPVTQANGQLDPSFIPYNVTVKNAQYLGSFSTAFSATPYSIPVTQTNGQLDPSFVSSSVTANNALALNSFSTSFSATPYSIPVTQTNGQLDPSFVPSSITANNALALNSFSTSFSAVPYSIPVTQTNGHLDPSFIQNTSLTQSMSSSFTLPLTGATVYFCYATNENITVSLTDAVSAISNNYAPIFTFKKADTTNNTITLQPANSETIDGQPTYVLSTPYQVVRIISNGHNWYVV